MSRAETLRHFNLACGVLPEDVADQPLVSEEIPDDFTSERPLDSFLDAVPVIGRRDIVPSIIAPPVYGAMPTTAPPGGGPPIYYPGFGGSGGGPGCARNAQHSRNPWYPRYAGYPRDTWDAGNPRYTGNSDCAGAEHLCAPAHRADCSSRCDQAAIPGLSRFNLNCFNLNAST